MTRHPFPLAPTPLVDAAAALAAAEVLATPGPTPLPQTVIQAMARQPVEIWGESLATAVSGIQATLRDLAGATAQDPVYFVIANGHGTWEAVLGNLFLPGDRVLVAQSGLFAQVWGQQAEGLGLEVQQLENDLRRPVDPDRLEATLRADTQHRIKAVLAVQVDTASGVRNDLPPLREAIDRAGHPALLLVDAIAGLSTEPLCMADWGVDLVLSASQKALMCPPGLGIVIPGPRALAVRDQRVARGGPVPRFWSWAERDATETWRLFNGTPPVHLVFALDAAMALIRAEGPAAVAGRHRRLGLAVSACCDHWAAVSGAIRPALADPAWRSFAVTTLDLPLGVDPQALRTFCEQHAGLVLGQGIGPFAERCIRIGHMGHVGLPWVLGVLGTLEFALAQQGIPHQPGGVAAALATL